MSQVTKYLYLPVAQEYSRDHIKTDREDHESGSTQGREESQEERQEERIGSDDHQDHVVRPPERDLVGVAEGVDHPRLCYGGYDKKKCHPESGPPHAEPKACD